MKRIKVSVTLCALMLMFATSACSSSSDAPRSSNADPQSGANGATPGVAQPDPAEPTEGEETEEGEEGGGAAQRSAFVRVAHLSPDAPAVDVCIKPTGSGDDAFIGPVLNDLLPDGLSFSHVTTYLPVPAGTYSARLVAPDATDCATSLAGLPDFELPTLAAGVYATAAATGLVAGSPAFTVQPFVDRRDVPSDKIAVRFVHASPGTPAVDVGIGSGASFTPIWTNVSFGSAGTNATTDANGFLVTDPLDNAVLSARATGTTTDALVLPPVSFEAGSVVSAFAIGLLNGTGDTRLSVLACQDRAAASGGLTPCVRVP